mgnify:CR=1 FL=1
MAYETYGEMFGDFVKRLAKYSSVEDVLRVMNIPYGHYRKVINPNNRTNGDNPYYQPVEWLVQATNYSARQRAEGVAGDYCMMKKVARDTEGEYLSPDELHNLRAVLKKNSPDPAELYAALKPILGEGK